MRCGISTACFYPENTLDALRRVVDTGAPVTEIFLNTFSELEDSFIHKLQEEVQRSGIEVSSVHPFSSAMEGFFFVSAYDGRFKDGMEIYRRFFEICSIFGCSKFVFHGDNKNNTAHVLMPEYVGRVQRIMQEAERYGVTICHENVAYCRLGPAENIAEYKDVLGEKAAFVLDTKQARRLQQNMPQMLAAMGNSIRHVHISDYSTACDCVAPGMGQMDYQALISRLKQQKYDGDLIIELYRDGFDTPKELENSMKYIASLL